jgi:AraC-like DNA-binding protein
MRSLIWRRPEGIDNLEQVSGVLEGEAMTTSLWDAYAVGYYQEGAVEVHHRGRTLPLVTGDAIVIDPQELVRPGDRKSRRGVFHALYVGRETLARAKGSVTGSDKLPAFGCRIVHEPALGQKIYAFVESIIAGAPALEQETRWLEVAAQLFESPDDVVEAPQLVSRVVKRAREYLHAHAEEPVSLEELARVADASKFHLVRAFHRTVGLPPHQYHLQLRLSRARALLATGASPAEVALHLGFADQSHFYRAFKRAFGITPGAHMALFRRAV